MKFSRWIFITGTLFIIFALIFSCGFTVSAVKLDGLIGTPEWKGSREAVIFTNENESNCAVSWAHLRVLEIPETNEIFFAFEVVDRELNYNYFNEESPYYKENTPAAVRLTVNGTEMYVYMNKSPEYNSEPYHVSSFFLPDESLSGYTAEIRIGVKLNFYSINTYGVRLVDCMGEPSSLYTLTIDNTPTTVQEPTRAVTVTAVEKPAVTAKPSSAKTTVASTTRRWIIKEKTTAPKTEPATTEAVPQTSAKAKAEPAKIKTNIVTEASVSTTQPVIADINQTDTTQEQTETKYIIISASTNENTDTGHRMKTSNKIVLAACVLSFIGFGWYGYFLQQHKNTPPVQVRSNQEPTDCEQAKPPEDENEPTAFEESEDTDEQAD